MGAVWSGQLTPAASATVDRVYAHARKAWPEFVIAPEKGAKTET